MTVNAAERDELERAEQRGRGVRNWEQQQAFRLLAQGQAPLEIAGALGRRHTRF